MLKFLLFVFFSFCALFDCLAQNKKNTDINLLILQVDSLNLIVDNLRKIYPDSALVITEKSEILANSVSYEEGRGIALKNKALIISVKGKYSEALIIIEKSISILEKTPNKIDLGSSYGAKAYLQENLGYIDEALKNYTKSIAILKSVTDLDASVRLAVSYNLLGIYYQKRGNYAQSVKCFNDALVLIENQNQQNFITGILTNLANTYMYQEEYDKAISYYEKIIITQTKTGYRAGLANSYNNLGGALLSQNKTEKALPYLEKAAQIYKEIGNTKDYILSQNNIGLIYYRQDEYEKAALYFKECLKLEEQIIDKSTLALIYNNLSATSSEQKKYDSAIVYAQKGLEIAKAIDSKRYIVDNLISLSLSYKGKKDFEKAYEYHVLYTSYKDSLFNIEKASEVNALLLEQKNLENIQLEKDNLIKQNDLQKERFETQTQKQAFLILEKQAEADRLLALAKQATNKQEADSLYRAAQTAQLEADNLKITAEKSEAEKRATKAENQQKIAFQRNLSILFGVTLLAALAIAFIAYRNQRNKQKANLLLAEKNEEINLQNELLGQSNTMKDQLFSIIAHDLRSPIAAFQSISKQINFFLRKDQPERLQEISSQIEISSQNLSNLLNNLLNWALTQQNHQIHIKKEQLSIAQNVEDVCKGYQIIATASQIELENTIPEDIFVCVDKDCFQTILRNLIGNAFKYTPEGGKVTISAIKQKSTVLLKVIDTGIGMSDKFKEKIFQLDVTTTSRGIRGEKGTGLGLVLCYEFAMLNDIKIDVESQEGQGTTFLLTIPTE